MLREEDESSVLRGLLQSEKSSVKVCYLYCLLVFVLRRKRKRNVNLTFSKIGQGYSKRRSWKHKARRNLVERDGKKTCLTKFDLEFQVRKSIPHRSRADSSSSLQVEIASGNHPKAFGSFSSSPLWRHVPYATCQTSLCPSLTH